MATMLAGIFGLILAFVTFAFSMWSQSRYDLAHDLDRVGLTAQAHDAEVRQRFRRYDTRAVVEFPEGSKTVDLPNLTPDTSGLSGSEWQPAPAPYDGTFEVRYLAGTPVDEDSIMAMSDVQEALGQDPHDWWTVFGFLLFWGLAWLSPTVRVVRADFAFYRAKREGKTPRYPWWTPANQRTDLLIAAGLFFAGICAFAVAA